MLKNREVKQLNEAIDAAVQALISVCEYANGSIIAELSVGGGEECEGIVIATLHPDHAQAIAKASQAWMDANPEELKFEQTMLDTRRKRPPETQHSWG